MAKLNTGDDQLSIRVDPQMRASLAAAAEQDGGRPVSSLVRAVLADWLKTRGAARGQARAA